jgi:hypothetical protein
MPLHGFGRKDEEEHQQLPSNLTTDMAITGKEDHLEEISKISHMLNANEEVFVVARQSTLKLGALNLLSNVV